MDTLQYEAVKVALKQDKTGYILTLNVHPDEVPEQLLRDFVGARYQVVMVRLNGDDQPMNREHEHSRDIVRTAGIMCRDPNFHKFLGDSGYIFGDVSETEAINWLKEYLDVQSRSELRENREAAMRFQTIYKEYLTWKQSA